MTHDHRRRRFEGRPPQEQPGAHVITRGNGAAPPIIVMDEGFVSRSAGAALAQSVRVERPHHQKAEPHFVRAAEAIERVRPDRGEKMNLDIESIRNESPTVGGYHLIKHTLREAQLTDTDILSLSAVMAARLTIER